MFVRLLSEQTDLENAGRNADVSSISSAVSVMTPHGCDRCSAQLLMFHGHTYCARVRSGAKHLERLMIDGYSSLKDFHASKVHLIFSQRAAYICSRVTTTLEQESCSVAEHPKYRSSPVVSSAAQPISYGRDVVSCVSMNICFKMHRLCLYSTSIEPAALQTDFVPVSLSGECFCQGSG